MAKPIIKEIEAFDASQETYVEFLWSGNAAYNNRMVIYDADTMLSVYDHTYSNFICLIGTQSFSVSHASKYIVLATMKTSRARTTR